jgi:hypothetical protein
LLSAYHFVKIADSADGLSDFGAAPALNNNGTVAFLASLPATDQRCLYTGDGGGLATIYCTPSIAVEQLSDFPSINDDGTVAFLWSPAPYEQQIVTGNGGPLTTLYQNNHYGFYAFDPPALNSAGVVAFHVVTLIESRPEEVVSGDGGPPTVIDHGDVFDSTHFGAFPALNNAGLVAYTVQEIYPSQSERAINLGDGQTVTTLYSDQDGVFATFGEPALNDDGVVVFFATLAGGGSGIFGGDGGPVVVVAQDGSVFSSFDTAPAINEYGSVVFAATLADGRGGIFTGPDVQYDTVITVGDALDGATVTELHFFRQGLNDNGQVAFFARLDNGASGIFRADPYLPPHPSPRDPAPRVGQVAFVVAHSGADFMSAANSATPAQPAEEMSGRSSGPAAVGTPGSQPARATGPKGEDTLVKVPSREESGVEPLEGLPSSEVDLFLVLNLVTWP